MKKYYYSLTDRAHKFPSCTYLSSSSKISLVYSELKWLFLEEITKNKCDREVKEVRNSRFAKLEEEEMKERARNPYSVPFRLF